MTHWSELIQTLYYTVRLWNKMIFFKPLSYFSGNKRGKLDVRGLDETNILKMGQQPFLWEV